MYIHIPTQNVFTNWPADRATVDVISLLVVEGLRKNKIPSKTSKWRDC